MRRLASASVSLPMPSPRSSTSMTYPLPTGSPVTRTRVCGGENWAAFSMSSAMRWVRSATAAPTTDASGRCRTSTRA